MPGEGLSNARVCPSLGKAKAESGFFRKNSSGGRMSGQAEMHALRPSWAKIKGSLTWFRSGIPGSSQLPEQRFGRASSGRKVCKGR